jgi:predicted transposase YbfD/YdcC
MVDLRKYLEQVTDPRDRRGVRHSLASMLTIAAIAVAAGARSMAAIGECAAEASQDMLRVVGARYDPRQARFVAPGEATLRRALSGVDGDELDAAISAWILDRTTPEHTTPEHTTPEHTTSDSDASDSDVSAPLVAVAVDGKTLRGTVPRTGGAGVHLLAALTHHTGTVVAQRLVPIGTSEIAWFTPLLDTLDLTGVVLTADALHTVRDHATYLTGRGGHYVFTVKKNQHRLHARLTALRWTKTDRHTTHDTGHHRTEHRTIQVQAAPDNLNFPGAAQVFRITRDRIDRTTGKHETHTWFGVTSLTVELADPARIAFLLRGHWEIENRLHWVRDVTYTEDHSRLRTGNAPRAMASLRNLAISALRLTGATNIAKALRHMARDPDRPLTLLGIPTLTSHNRL